MTSYSSMAERGREEARARTAGRRKVTAERIEYDEPDRSNVTPLPGVALPPYRAVVGRLVGSCGHTLRWHAAVSVVDGEPSPTYYLREKVGRKMTCPHDDCRIPEHVYTDADCTYVMGAEVERQCTTAWKHDTEMGKVCRRHFNHYVREGYIDQEGRMLP